MEGEGAEALRRGLAVAVVATVAAFVGMAGCGSTSSQSGAAANAIPEVGTAEMSQEEFVKRANAACTKESTHFIEEVTQFSQRYEEQKKPEAGLLNQIVAQIYLPRVEREIAAVAALGAPSGEQGQVEAILVAKQEGIERAEALSHPKSIVQVEAQFDEAQKLAQEYGIHSCG